MHASSRNILVANSILAIKAWLALAYLRMRTSKSRVYNKEGGRVSYSSIVPSTAVVRVQTRSMIFTMCGMSLWVEGYGMLCVCRASND